MVAKVSRCGHFFSWGGRGCWRRGAVAASERGAGGMSAAPLVPLSDNRGGKSGSDVVCGNRLIAAQHHETGCDYDKMRRPNMLC